MDVRRTRFGSTLRFFSRFFVLLVFLVRASEFVRITLMFSCALPTVTLGAQSVLGSFRFSGEADLK